MSYLDYVCVERSACCGFEVTSKGARSCHTVLLQATGMVMALRELGNVFEVIWTIATQSQAPGVVRTEVKPNGGVSNVGLR